MSICRRVVDAVRTDSHLEFYEDPKNLARMSDILAVYAWVDPQTGYCQGMSDLLSLFVLLFEDDADAFWGFEMLLRRVRDNLWHILELIDRDIFSHLSRIGAENLHFAFRMLHVLFRRELSFNEALCMWEVSVKVIHVGVGPISESDIGLAQACGACIVGFNVRNPPSSVGHAAARASVKTVLHRVIYHLLEDMGNLIVEKAPGTPETQVVGEAQVLDIFEVKGRSKYKGEDFKIAGCRVIDGRVCKSCTMRLLRSGEVVFEGSCASLKQEKHDVEAAGKGKECGLVLQGYIDFQVGDVIQCLEQVNRKPKFISSDNGAVQIEC